MRHRWGWRHGRGLEGHADVFHRFSRSIVLHIPGQAATIVQRSTIAHPR